MPPTTIQPIPFRTVDAFCSENPERYQIVHPKKIDGKTVATDGRALIEVATGEVQAFSEVEPERGFPKYLSVLEPFPEGEFQKIPITIDPEAKRNALVRCEDCDEGLIECNCPDCHLQFHDCDTCGGKGEYVDDRKWIVPILGEQVAGYLMERICRLPDLTWQPAETHKPGDGLFFRFGVTGRGKVMPLRVKREEGEG